MPKLYLLDANALIAADRDYFSMNRIPQYWKWLLIKADAGIVKIPGEIYQEITPGNDDFSSWIKDQTNKDKLILNEQVDKTIFNEVINRGYKIQSDGEESRSEVSEIENDAILIAYAMAHKDHRIVVTKEESKPNRKKGNRKIPDVCKDLGIECIDDYEFQRRCDFRIP